MARGTKRSRKHEQNGHMTFSAEEIEEPVFIDQLLSSERMSQRSDSSARASQSRSIDSHLNGSRSKKRKLRHMETFLRGVVGTDTDVDLKTMLEDMRKGYEQRMNEAELKRVRQNQKNQARAQTLSESNSERKRQREESLPFKYQNNIIPRAFKLTLASDENVLCQFQPIDDAKFEYDGKTLAEWIASLYLSEYTRVFDFQRKGHMEYSIGEYFWRQLFTDRARMYGYATGYRVNEDPSTDQTVIAQELFHFYRYCGLYIDERTFTPPLEHTSKRSVFRYKKMTVEQQRGALAKRCGRCGETIPKEKQKQKTAEPHVLRLSCECNRVFHRRCMMDYYLRGNFTCMWCGEHNVAIVGVDKKIVPRRPSQLVDLTRESSMCKYKDCDKTRKVTRMVHVMFRCCMRRNIYHVDCIRHILMSGYRFSCPVCEPDRTIEHGPGPRTQPGQLRGCNTYHDVHKSKQKQRIAQAAKQIQDARAMPPPPALPPHMRKVPRMDDTD